MAKVAIIGGGISGLAAALYLSKQDHQITLFERDDAPMPNSANEAFEWDRRGAPQVHHSHAMLARLRNLLRNDHPEVLKRLVEAGASEIKMYESRPPGPAGEPLNPLDEEIVMIASRRTTLEWVLRTSVLESGCVDFRSGVDVAGLIASTGKRPHVSGIVQRDGTQHQADLIIAADGRRSEVPKWLTDLDVVPEPETREPAGIVYFSRFYRLHEAEEFPTTDLVAGDTGYLGFAAFCGDDGTFSITLSIPEDDMDLRRAANKPEIFESIARMIPETAPWTQRADPITPVHSMASLFNRRRYFLRDGAPLVTGFHVIGDAHISTNPAYGRGLSTGFWQAQLVAQAVAAHPTDSVDQGLQFCQAVEEHIVPWFDAAVMMDQSKRTARADESSDSDSAPASNPMAALAAAASVDLEVWRSFWRTMNLLEPPSTLMQPEFLAQVVAAAAKATAGYEAFKEASNAAPTRAEMFVLLKDRERIPQ